MSFCTNPDGYHEHSCPGYTLERIADALERIAAGPTDEELAQRREDAQSEWSKANSISDAIERTRYLPPRAAVMTNAIGGPRTDRGVR